MAIGDEPLPAPANVADLYGRRMLIVDDTPANRALLLAQCEDLGLSCVSASTASEALERMRGAVRDGRVPEDSEGRSEPTRSAAPAPESQCIDSEALAEVHAMDHDGSLVTGIVALYRQDGATLVRNVRLASERGDAAALAFSSHTLKSSSGCVGARQVMSLCARFEARARANGELCTVEELVALESAFQASCAALSSHLTPRPSP